MAPQICIDSPPWDIVGKTQSCWNLWPASRRTRTLPLARWRRYLRFIRDEAMPHLTQSAMLVLTGPFQMGYLPLESQQRFLGRTTRVETSRHMRYSSLSSWTEVFLGLPVLTPGRTLCTNSRTNVMLSPVPVDEFGDSSLREVGMMSNHCFRPAHHVPKTYQVHPSTIVWRMVWRNWNPQDKSPTRLLVVNYSTTGQMLTQSIQVHVVTVVYTPFSDNPLSTLCNLWYSPITDSCMYT